MNEKYAEYTLEVWGYDAVRNPKDQRMIDAICECTSFDENGFAESLYQEGQNWAGFVINSLPKELALELEDKLKKMGYGASMRLEAQNPVVAYFVEVRGYEAYGHATSFLNDGIDGSETRRRSDAILNVAQEVLGRTVEFGKEIRENGGVLTILTRRMGAALELKRRIEALSDEYIVTLHTGYGDFDYSTLEANGKKLEIKNLDEMKDYLRSVYTLEKELYIAKEGKEKVFHRIVRTGSKSIPTREEIDEKSVSLYTAGCFVGGLIPMFWLKFMLDITWKGAFTGLVIVCAIIALSIVMSNRRKWNEANKKYNEEFDQLEKQRQQSIPEIADYQKREQEFDETIVSCMDALNELYGYDIIFPKYRNFVAISQIYEYFASGRVTELGGPDGAYNLFESELRQNIIICELSTIIRQLEDIKTYQRMTYDAISESNRLLRNIEQNTAVTAFNSAAIAENTNIMRKYTNIAVYNN